MAEEAPFDPEGIGILQGDPDVNAQLQPRPRVTSAEEYEKVAHGASYLDPEGKQRFKPIRNKQDWMAIDEGAEYADPTGQIRVKPKYEGIDFTAQTLYDMSVNDKERRKALERSYPGKVQEDPAGGFFVEDDGTLRKPGRGIAKVTGAAASAAAPTILSVLGALGGGAAGGAGGAVAGSVVPVAGTVAGGLSGGTAGAALGGAGGAVLGQGFNDMIMALSGTYDRTPGEELTEQGLAALGGMAGAGVGRGISTVVPSLKSGLSAATAAAPGMARSFLGAGKENLEMASSLAEKGVAVPPSAWAKEAPHLQNVVEVFDPAFHTNQPLLESATAHYEKSAGEILQALGVKDPGSLTKPIADVPTKEAGEAVMRRTLGELADSDARLQAALAERKAKTERMVSLPEGTTPHGGVPGYEGYKTPIRDVGGKEVGAIEYVVEPDHVKIRYPFIADEARGQGLGVSTYEHLADWALSRGKELRSGTDVSPMAMRVYEALARRGYKVVWPADMAKATTHTGAYAGTEGIRVVEGPAGKAMLTQRETVLKAAEEARTAAQKVIDAGYKDIEGDIKTGMKVAEAGHNSGDLWQAIGNKFITLRRAVGERMNIMVNDADQTAGGHLPNIEGLPHHAEEFLQQLPPDFQGKYPDIVKKLRDLAGVKDEKTGEWIKEPFNPGFAQLRNMRTQMRQNINYTDLTPDVREGVYKFFAGKLNAILHDAGAVPELKEAARLLDKADAFYAENIKLFNANQVKAVMRGLEAGEPADPQTLYNVLVKAGWTDFSELIKEKVGSNLWAGVAAADKQAMFDASKTLLPDVIDGKVFAKEVLARHKAGTLELVHGKEGSQKLIEQAQRIEMLDGRLPIPVRPGDTVTQVIARARQAEELAKAEAKRDPLATLTKEMRKIEIEGKREAAKMAAERRKDPLGFLYNPTTGAAEAVDKILGSEDLILAAAARFGETSPEFEMLRQVWAQRLLTGTLRPSERLAKVSPEVQAKMFQPADEIQQIVFPGVTLQQAKTLAKEMDFLLDTRSGSRGTAQGMAAMAKVEHPWGSLGSSKSFGGALLKGVGGSVPGSSAAARSALGAYYGTMRKLMTSPALLRWLEKGLSGSPADREAVRQSIAAVLQKGGAVGAGVGEAAVQGSGPQ